MSKIKDLLYSNNDKILTADEINYLINAGLSEIQVYNYIKKNKSYKQILKELGPKIEDNLAKKWLDDRFGKNVKIPKRSLPVLTKKEESTWKLHNPKQWINLTYPLLPSVNTMYQTSRSTGARQLTSVCKKLFVEMQDMLDNEIIRQNWQPVYKTYIIASLYFYYPDRIVRDSHNMFKFLFDTMDGILLDNDYYIMPRVEIITIDEKNPRIEVKLHIA